jgi:four helix bundle protein
MADTTLKKIEIFVFFSRGSILETKGWLIKSKNRNLINEDQFNSLFEKLQTIHLKLNAYLKFIGKNAKIKADQ